MFDSHAPTYISMIPSLSSHLIYPQYCKTPSNSIRPLCPKPCVTAPTTLTEACNPTSPGIVSFVRGHQAWMWQCAGIVSLIDVTLCVWILMNRINISSWINTNSCYMDIRGKYMKWFFSPCGSYMGGMVWEYVWLGNYAENRLLLVQGRIEPFVNWDVIKAKWVWTWKAEKKLVLMRTWRTKNLVSHYIVWLYVTIHHETGVKSPLGHFHLCCI